MKKKKIHTRLWWDLALAVSIVCVVLPILATRYLPFTDAPEHAAVMATLRHLGDPDYGAPYELNLLRSQYLAYHAFGALLTISVTGDDAELANRLLLALTGVLFPISFRFLLRATSRDERLALFACLPFWSRSLVIGFLPFVASIPIALFTIGLFIRCVRLHRPRPDPRHRRQISLALIAVLLFYTHVSTWLLAMAIVIVLAIVTKKPRALLAFIPSMVFAAIWLVFGKLTMSEGNSLASEGEVTRMNVGRSMLLMPRWIFDVWRSHGDELAAIAWWLAFLLVAIVSVRSIRRLTRGSLIFLYAPLMTALVVYLATPWRVGAGAMLNVRLAPILVLLALLPTRLNKSLPASIALGLAMLANLAGGITALRECRRAAREELGDFDGLLAAIPKGARLVTLTSDLRTQSTHIYPWFHVGAYHRVRCGGIASFSFTELQHWPLHYVPGPTRPPRKDRAAWDFDPCTYRNTIDGEFYDYVLLRGALDPFAKNPPGPIYRPIFKTADFVLMKKAIDEAKLPLSDERRDLGPCGEPPPK